MATIRRLRRRPDFLAAAEGKRWHVERMTAQGRLRASDEMRDGAPAHGLHVGFTITKRVGHATERNRIRRRLRAALATLAPEAPDAPADVVLIARRPALDAPFGTLVDDLRRALAAVTRPRPPKAARSAREDGAGPASGDTTSGARRRSRAHVPRRANPGTTLDNKTSGREPGPNTVHGSTDG